MTAEERASAEDIKNANKEEIVKRIAEKLQQVSDEDIREVMVKKFDILKVQHSKVKKEHLIMFYNEVIEELQQQAAQDEICIIEEEEQEGWIDSSVYVYQQTLSKKLLTSEVHCSVNLIPKLPPF